MPGLFWFHLEGWQGGAGLSHLNGFLSRSTLQEITGVTKYTISDKACGRLQCFWVKGADYMPRAAARVVDDQLVEVEHHHLS